MKKIGLLALLALALAVPASASAAGAHKVTMIGEDNKVLAEFFVAKCQKFKYSSRTSFLAKSRSSNGKYFLEAHIDSFTGFHRYDVSIGQMDPEILVEPTNDNSGDGDFSNRYAPPYPVPGAGAIQFHQGSPLLGVGFGPALWSRDSSSAVVLAGVVKCKYPKKKGK